MLGCIYIIYAILYLKIEINCVLLIHYERTKLTLYFNLKEVRLAHSQNENFMIKHGSVLSWSILDKQNMYTYMYIFCMNANHCDNESKQNKSWIYHLLILLALSIHSRPPHFFAKLDITITIIPFFFACQDSSLAPSHFYFASEATATY